MRIFLMVSVLTLLFMTSSCELQNIKPDSSAEVELPDVVETQHRAQAAYEAGDWETATQEYTQLTKLLPNDGAPWFRLGNVYARMQQPDTAIAAYREAAIRDPNNTKIWHNMGIVQLRQATNTFIEMQQYAKEGDPLAERGRYVIDAMSQIMEKGFGATE